jgi:starch-binding outer membrane protein, SusD/RagB family
VTRLRESTEVPIRATESSHLELVLASKKISNQITNDHENTKKPIWIARAGSMFVLIASLVVIYGCEDFLVGNAQGVLDDNTLANQNGVEGNLISAYSMLDGFAFGNPWPTAASNWVFGNVAADDAYKGSEPGDQPEMTDIEFYQWSTGGTDSYMNAKWSNLYEAVNRTNATLRLLEQVEDISDADRNRIRGEALFLRAHYHFEAWKMWENIPYYTEDDDDYRKSNVNVDAIGLILSDLDTAIDLLPQTQSHVGRVTEWTARAYKGRVQVYSGDYPGGLTTLGMWSTTAHSHWKITFTWCSLLFTATARKLFLPTRHQRTTGNRMVKR